MILYKYFPCNINTFKCLSERGLWCHYAKNMNDPFECVKLLNRNISEEQCNSFLHYIKTVDVKNSTLEKLIKLLSICDPSDLIAFIRNAIVDQFTFCSLSEDMENILMWSHYSDYHRGIAVGFDFSNIINEPHLQKINYCNKLPSFNLEKFGKYLNSQDSYFGDLVKDISIKLKVWENEKEWRLWSKYAGYYSIEEFTLKKIIYGYSCSKETMKIIFNITKNYPENIKYYKMTFVKNPPGLKPTVIGNKKSMDILLS